MKLEKVCWVLSFQLSSVCLSDTDAMNDLEGGVEMQGSGTVVDTHVTVENMRDAEVNRLDSDAGK